MKKRLFIFILLGAMLLLSFTGCGEKNITSGSDLESTIKTSDIHQSIRTAYGEDYLPNAEIPADVIKSEFGLSEDMYSEISAEMPMIGFHPDRVVIVKAKDGKADEVEKALKKALDEKKSSSVQYPANIAKINSAEVVRNGNYVAFLLVGAVDDNEDATEAEASEYAKKQMEKSIKAFNDSFK